MEHFLKKLGYEVGTAEPTLSLSFTDPPPPKQRYITRFLSERIGVLELPHITEEQLVRLGIPMGPRLRIMHEAHLL